MFGAIVEIFRLPVFIRAIGLGTYGLNSLYPAAGVILFFLGGVTGLSVACYAGGDHTNLSLSVSSSLIHQMDELSLDVRVRKRLSPSVKAALTRQWGSQYENFRHRAVRFPVRLLTRPLLSVTEGRVAGRIKSLLKVPQALLRGQAKLGYLRLNESVLNPLPTASDLISDVTSFMRSPGYSHLRLSRRVKVCSSGLTGIFLLDPTEHIEIMVDGFDEQGEPIMHQNCQSVPVLANESDSVVIERLSCVKRRFDTCDFNPINYNCGGVSRDILKFSGMGFLIFPNVGIGTLFSDHTEPNYYTSACDQELDYFRNVFTQLELGGDFEEFEFSLRLGQTHSVDLLLQLIVSAARGKDSVNRERVVRQVRLSETQIESYFASSLDSTSMATSWRSCTSKRAHGRIILWTLKSYLTRMFVDLDFESLSWILHNYPKLQPLLGALGLDELTDDWI